jgi:hypothetical protein
MATNAPIFMPRQSESVYANTALVGARFVKRSGAPGPNGNYGVVPCTAAARSCGVAFADTPVNTVGLIYGQPGTIVQVTAGAALTAGQEVESDANGQAIVLASGKSLGIVCKDAASGALAEVELR